MGQEDAKQWDAKSLFFQGKPSSEIEFICPTLPTYQVCPYSYRAPETVEVFPPNSCSNPEAIGISHSVHPVHCLHPTILCFRCYLVEVRCSYTGHHKMVCAVHLETNKVI
ncbi:hypothetical protein CEXT_402931 [Caerostris extrusa]|uniref:Uncharacterized protein n=1 Tax=Caerostris extrusa TaxID=172846 RepID=A0AAV4QPY3_CAEEX|nr:hypothetical protein CEXT_402931 [Caerostris extrusa]